MVSDISILPTNSSAVLPLLLDIPGLTPSLHVTIYLPTWGKNKEFSVALAELDSIVSSLVESHPDVPLYIRGDANVNSKNICRSESFSAFLLKFGLVRTELSHYTYHHFMGEGVSDSQLDVLLFKGSVSHAEAHIQIFCKKEDPLIISHHDLKFPSNKKTSLLFHCLILLIV